MITVKRPTKRDVNKLTEISVEIFKINKKYDLFYRDEWDLKDLNKYYLNIIKSKNIIFCAYDQKEIIGYLYAKNKTDDNRIGKCLEVVELGVVKEFRRKGIGKILMKKCFNSAYNLKYDRVTVNCYSKNKSAIRFYNQLGFNTTEVNLDFNL